MVSDVEQQLRERLNAFNSAPFLFIGSGIARRYYGLPDWETLLVELAGLIDVNYGEIYSLSDGNMPRVATTLANLLHPKWFHDNQFKDSREKFEYLVKTVDDVIKIEASKIIKSRNTFIDGYEDEIAELRKVVIDGIITTNYDEMLEKIFGNELSVFVGQDSMLKSPIHRISEIYKIHGSVANPPSMVLTSGDYKKFDDKNHYLAAILTQIFVEHPVVFLGYSISDKNIQDILSKVVSMLDKELLEKLSDRLIFVERAKDGQKPLMTPAILVFSEGKIQLPVTKITTEDYSLVYRPLQEFKREIPAKYLRIFKDTAHIIALHHSPESKLILSDLDATNHENNKFIFGHGVMSTGGLKGVYGIERDDVIKNLIEIDDSYNSEQVFLALSPLLKKPGIVPLGKYFIQTGRAKFNNRRWEIEVPSSFTESQRKRVLTYFRNDTKDYYAYNSASGTIIEFNKRFKNVNQVVNEYGITVESIKRIGWLPFSAIDTDDLREFLVKCIQIDKGSYSTAYYKLTTLYDFLKYIYRGTAKPRKAIIIN